MQTAIPFRLVGVLCVMLISALFIGCGQNAGSPWESYNQAGSDAYEQGNYAEAEKQWSAALQEAGKFGPEDPRLATSLNNQGELYRAQGKYSEAESFFQRWLAISEKALDPEHPEMARGLNNLALLYNDQGKYAEAEPLNRRALAIREKALGPAHPDVAGSLNNLAMLYGTQGKYAEAEPLCGGHCRSTRKPWEESILT